MIVPFSAADFLDRALPVHPERVGVVDEPDQPAPSLGSLSYAAAPIVRAQVSVLTQAELIAYCKTKIACNKAPTSVELRDALARTATGKLQQLNVAGAVLGMPRQTGQPRCRAMRPIGSGRIAMSRVRSGASAWSSSRRRTECSHVTAC